MPTLSAAALTPFLVGGALFGVGGGPSARPVARLAATSPVSTTPVSQTPAATTPEAAVRPNRPDGPAKAAPKRCVSDAAIATARRYALSRPGSVSFAVYERSGLRSFRGGVPYRSASLVKAMLLVADLRQHADAHRSLDAVARARLTSMIRVSDNAAATATFNTVGQGAVVGVAHLVGMHRYSVNGYWGSSELTATDQARLWGRLDQFLPAQYRRFGRRLLRTVVPDQTWGGAPVARRHGFTTMFKSGWLPRTNGWVVHQGMRLERGGCTVGIAVLTGGQPSMGAGIESIRGVTERLL